MTTLSPATLSALQKLASQSAPIASDRSSHFENLHHTLLAFLTGTQPITEADALLLTRARFAPTAKVGALHRLKAALSFKTLHPTFNRELSAHALTLLWSFSLTYVLTSLVYIPLIFFSAAWTAFQTRQNFPNGPSLLLAAILWPTFFAIFFTLRRKLPPRFTPASPRFWQRTAISIAAALALPIAAIHLFNLLWGTLTGGNLPEGIFLYFLPEDPLWVRAGGTHFAEYCLLVLWALGSTALLTLFVKSTPHQRRPLALILAIAVFLLISFLLRAVVAAASLHAQWSHGLFGYDPLPTITHRLVVYSALSSLHDLAAIVLALLLAAALAFFARFRNPRSLTTH